MEASKKREKIVASIILFAILLIVAIPTYQYFFSCLRIRVKVIDWDKKIVSVGLKWWKMVVKPPFDALFQITKNCFVQLEYDKTADVLIIFSSNIEGKIFSRKKVDFKNQKISE